MAAPACALYEAAKIGNGPKLAEVLGASTDDLNWTDSKGWTPLHVAAYNANYDAVRLLLGVPGVEINKVGLDSETPLFLAVEKGNLEVAKILLTAGADAERPNRRSLTPLYVACEQNNAEMVKSLLNSPCPLSMNTADRRERTPLMIAARNGSAEIVKLLLSRKGADVNRSDQDGVTPLNAACAKGAIDVARILLQHNADVNRADITGTAPLHHAAGDSNAKLVELLMSFGAKVTTPRSSDGKSPLDLAKSADIKALMQRPPTMQEIPPPPTLSPPSSTFPGTSGSYLYRQDIPSPPASSPLLAPQPGSAYQNGSGSSGALALALANAGGSPQPAISPHQNNRPTSPPPATRKATVGTGTMRKESRAATPGREAIFAPIPPPGTAPAKEDRQSLRDSQTLAPAPTSTAVLPPQKHRPHSGGESSNSPSPAAVSPLAASPPVQYVPSGLRPNSPPGKMYINTGQAGGGGASVAVAQPVQPPPLTVAHAMLNDKFVPAPVYEKPVPIPIPASNHGGPPSPKPAAAAMLAKRQSGSAAGGTHRPPIVPQVVSGELRFLERIGEGAFGEVWKAKYRSTTVAVKRTHAILNALDSEAQEEFRNEASIQSSIRHPYIVLLIGTSMDSDGKGLLITEYVDGGSLYHVLYVQRRLFERKVQRRLALHLATGLAFLHAHTPPIVHRDLKPENIFLGADGCFAKIGDLGFAKMKTSQNALRTQAGTQLYMAPEMLRAETYTAAVDVYSFALVAFEIYTGVRPYPTSWSFPVMFKQVGQGSYRPPIPASMVPDVMASVITRAWQAEPNDRPSMAEIVEILEEHEF